MSKQRIVSLILLFFVLCRLLRSIHDFDAARNWFELCKAIPFLVLGGIVFWSLIIAIHKNVWFWESEEILS